MEEDLILALPDPPTDYIGPQVLSLPAKTWETTVEAFGRAYEDYLRVVHGLEKLELENVVEASEIQEDAEEDSKYQGHRKKTVADLFTENYYELLGLGHLKWKASQDDIKKAYRQAVLVHHPDKQAQASNTSDDEVFKKIQTAYETLTNPKLKKSYDSKEPFDDTIPSADDVTSDAQFFKVFRPVFERNAKWSVEIVVPGLGDETTPINQVNKFYSFWYALKSWRDYSYLDEYDPEEAGSREEKRWMERRNAKERSKREREEQARVRRLIDLSYKLDPRIKKQQEQEQREKEEARQRRAEMIKKKQEEEERKKREEREKEEAEQQRLKDEKEAEQKERTRINRLRKKKRQIIRQVARTHGASESNADYLCENLELEQLSALASLLSTVTDPNKTKIEAIMNDALTQKKQADDQKQADIDSKTDDTEDEQVVWSPEEISLLTKAVIKFPGGTRERWEKISEFIGGQKTVKQIIAKVRASQHGAQRAAPTASQAQARTTAASPQQPKQSPKPKQQPTQQAAPQSPTEEAKASAEATWTPEEQKLLEDALKTFPASLGKDRWAKIAEAVPGRSRRDCVERYKYLVSMIQQNK